MLVFSFHIKGIAAANIGVKRVAAAGGAVSSVSITQICGGLWSALRCCILCIIILKLLFQLVDCLVSNRLV